MYKIFNTAGEASEYTARRLLNQIRLNPRASLGFATGSTMEPVYRFLVKCLKRDPLDLSQLTTFNLDEYIGLSRGHAQSYRYYMQHHLFNKLSIPEDKVNLPDGKATDVSRACHAYSEAIEAVGGLDFQLLGIGSNGHIGFNEPYTCFFSRTHVVELSEQTRLDNGRFFANKKDVPTQAITMGIQDILDAKEIVLLATGSKKAAVMADLYRSAADVALPASALKQHGNVTFVLDREAASLLPREVLGEAMGIEKTGLGL
ncbi:glucosamine-6-phosphate deaminase [Marinobacter xiaoshiensis]|uniref:Glucosamine-6-phosphate deaminase n=1 Tax=Marinobacter xiaoshiensis TaxID=3073652 RepID=A0ABU2HFX2_9GAMM|nr:glucosamine-6-phosphate deaminase [Marinobacter sp. F60267]MDS1309491.1 glucosamine-6-phosphate deaminase [Marinobacter sp. F60267]